MERRSHTFILSRRENCSEVNTPARGRNDRVKVKRPLVTVEVWCGTKPEQGKGEKIT